MNVFGKDMNGSNGMKKVFGFLMAAIIFVCCAGCPSMWSVEETKDKATPEALFQKAEDLYDKKKYAQAIDAYEQLKSAHPDYKDSSKVYLRIADAFFAEKQYEKAIGRYHQFVELYPNDREAPRARYNIAMSLFSQIKNTDLDSRIIQKSAEAFKALADDPDAGEWAKKAEEKYRECRQKLAEKEYYKAKTYISMGNYKAAKLVARRILDDYPKLGFDEQANTILKK